MHWDPEPTPNPSQEGNWQDTDERLLTSLGAPASSPARLSREHAGRDAGAPRFMESPHDFDV